MLGKILPYIVRRATSRSRSSSRAARLLFDVPMLGSLRAAGSRSCSSSSPPTSPSASPSRPLAREPAAGDADDVLLLPAVDPALGLHVPVPRHAGLGAGARRGPAAHALPAHRARHHAQGQRRGARSPPSCGRSPPSCSSPARWRCAATGRRWTDAHAAPKGARAMSPRRPAYRHRSSDVSPDRRTASNSRRCRASSTFPHVIVVPGTMAEGSARNRSRRLRRPRRCRTS